MLMPRPVAVPRRPQLLPSPVLQPDRPGPSGFHCARPRRLVHGGRRSALATAGRHNVPVKAAMRYGRSEAPAGVGDGEPIHRGV
ncbi:MAG: hypothetical protein ACK5PF_12345, partial [bacterium]